MLQKYHIFLKSTLWMTSLSCFFLLWQGFSTINLINTLFLVSLFFFCVYGFKWIIDQGTFYTFEYSWQKTKRYVLFFLPKYWSIKDTKDRNKLAAVYIISSKDSLWNNRTNILKKNNDNIIKSISKNLKISDRYLLKLAIILFREYNNIKIDVFNILNNIKKNDRKIILNAINIILK